MCSLALPALPALSHCCGLPLPWDARLARSLVDTGFGAGLPVLGSPASFHSPLRKSPTTPHVPGPPHGLSSLAYHLSPLCDFAWNSQLSPVLDYELGIRPVPGPPDNDLLAPGVPTPAPLHMLGPQQRGPGHPAPPWGHTCLPTTHSTYRAPSVCSGSFCLALLLRKGSVSGLSPDPSRVAHSLFLTRLLTAFLGARFTRHRGLPCSLAPGDPDRSAGCSGQTSCWPGESHSGGGVRPPSSLCPGHLCPQSSLCSGASGWQNGYSSSW